MSNNEIDIFFSIFDFEINLPQNIKKNFKNNHSQNYRETMSTFCVVNSKAKNFNCRVYSVFKWMQSRKQNKALEIAQTKQNCKCSRCKQLV